MLLSMEQPNNAHDNECKEVFYLQQISFNVQEKLFKTPWATVIVQNCDNEGKLLEFKSKADYATNEKNLWLNLPLKIFRENGELFPVFCCPECPSMKGFQSLKTDCRTDQFLPLLCIHSKTVSFLVKDWDEVWDIHVDEDDANHVVLCNRDTVAITLHSKESKNSGFFLGAVLFDHKIFTQYTVTKRQNVSFCSGHSCLLSHCCHSKKYLETVNGHSFVQDFDPIIRSDIDPDEGHLDVSDDIALEGHGEEFPELGDDDDNLLPENASEQNSSDDEADDDQPNELSNSHYLNKLSEKEYTKMCGYNFSEIIYPIKESKSQQEMWLKQVRREYDFPDMFVPPYSSTNVCDHGYMYDSDDRNLGTESATMIIFYLTGEEMFKLNVKFRNSLGRCKCMQHFDGHPFFLWHLGKGRFVSYCLLIHYLHLWVNDGTPMFALFRTVQDNAKSPGVSSTLTYLDLHRSIVCFFRQLRYDEIKAFSCPKHNNNPKWINTDGKYVGPTKKKCKHLMELDRAPNDDDVLDQSTKFQDRVFLPKPKERKEVVSLLTGSHSSEKAIEFVGNLQIESANGQLLQDLVDHIEEKYPGDLPRCYKRFIENVCKPTSVRGLIQVTNFIPLDILQNFCNEDIDLKDIENIEELRLMQEQIPVLWTILDDICLFEGETYLPRTVSGIVLKLLDIRKNTFINAAKRNEIQYVPYEGGEHPTMCYPNNKLKEYPKKYKVNSRTDKDLCEKAFGGHKDFTAGIFSMGCACEYNITLGELK